MKRCVDRWFFHDAIGFCVSMSDEQRWAEGKWTVPFSGWWFHSCFSCASIFGMMNCHMSCVWHDLKLPIMDLIVAQQDCRCGKLRFTHLSLRTSMFASRWFSCLHNSIYVYIICSILCIYIYLFIYAGSLGHPGPCARQLHGLCEAKGNENGELEEKIWSPGDGESGRVRLGV